MRSATVVVLFGTKMSFDAPTCRRRCCCRFAARTCEVLNMAFPVLLSRIKGPSFARKGEQPRVLRCVCLVRDLASPRPFPVPLMMRFRRRDDCREGPDAHRLSSHTWRRRFARAFTCLPLPPPPALLSRRLKLVFRSLETSPAATFLRAGDASKAMGSLRSAVKEAACNPQVGEPRG